MEKWQRFLEEYTNSDSFFDYSERDKPESLEWDMFHTYLLPNGMARWYMNSTLRRIGEVDEVIGQVIKDEVWAVALEEQLIHPVISMQFSLLRADELLRSLAELSGGLLKDVFKWHDLLREGDPEGNKYGVLLYGY